MTDHRRGVARMIAVLLLTALLLSLSVLAVSATDPAPKTRVYGSYFGAAETAELNDYLNRLSEEHDVELYLMVYDETRFYTYTEWDFFEKQRDLRGENAVLLIINCHPTGYGEDEFYYDMYTYGRAAETISDVEVDYILDHEDVYDNIKGGSVAGGAEAFFTMSAQGYSGRVGTSYWLIIPVCFVISLVIAAVVVISVASSYKRRPQSATYPLDQYAQLDLRAESDSFTGNTLTRSYSPRSRGGSRGGGGGGGGGGGHRGGR